MADREESIHVVIKLDIDPEDDDKIQRLAGKVDETGKDPKLIKKDKEQSDVNDKVQAFTAGNVGKVQNFTGKQFGNLKSMISNPSQFIIGAFMKKFVKAGIAIGIGLLIWEMINWAIDEAFKAGRIWDRRFRRVAQQEILSFYTRKTQEELRQGFKSIRVTTMAGLRGGRGQVSGNLFQFSPVTGMIQGSPFQSSEDIITTEEARGRVTTASGNPTHSGATRYHK